ncbi:glycosyltransferase family 4 protein [Companilactobacillus allii]|uniref:Glycosyltransferase n=1 Tax=Companilactobacillus allii TaxID=1847728 RepID=A0A1P8Q3H1_9LACO|nr:glycosyltransferase family 4 protein [Companilactobacillus allii]APX72402.1 glycosyltransferase [Companilactobacillus allii]USQ69494.1 glycosyltransferase family 4 protein [Companilactobacillus allii]
MIKINMFSSADKVAGQGVGSAYVELINLLKDRFSNEFDIKINNYGRSDLSHYHTIDPQFYLSTFSKKRGRKIGYVHFLPETLEGSIKLPKPARMVFYKYVIDFYKRMDQIVVVNPTFIDKLVKHGLDREKIKYIPNFVSTENFYEKTKEEKIDFRKKIGIPEGKFIVFGDGQVQERKGIDDFFKLAELNPDIEFIWAGGFSFGKITDGYDRYKRMVENPPKNMKFTGIVDRNELVNYYNVCDLFLLPSYDELFPMSVLEAFSCGAPVLLRDLDLYKAIIDGYYQPANNRFEMNDFINKANMDRSILDKFKVKSKAATNQYSEDNLSKIWYDFYNDQYKIAKRDK